MRIIWGVGLYQRRGLLPAADGDREIPGDQLLQLWLAGFPPILLRKEKKNTTNQNSDEKYLILAQNREDRGSDILKKVI